MPVIISKASRNNFTVSFAGEFSHGKSTLINRLLEKNILPVDDIPTTALLTQIAAGPKAAITVLDSKGKVIEQLPVEAKSWEHLTAFDENGNKNDLSGSRYVRITDDFPWLRGTHVEIYDTPGANDGSKEHDLEISRALMSADGAVICLDAQKGLMATQEAFIKDRVLGPKVPYVALVLTHLDMISPDKVEKVVISIMARLKILKVELPVILANDVEALKEKFGNITGVEPLRDLISRWSVSSDRTRRVEEWVVANVSRILDNALGILAQKAELLNAREDERQQLIIEKQKVITDMHAEWEKLRKEIEDRCADCRVEFRRKLHHERNAIIDAMLYRIRTVPDPAKWYRQSYAYEISARLSASIISLDNVVTECARNDLEAVNREIVQAYRTSLERNAKSWGRTADTSAYFHGAAPEMADIDKMRNKSNTIAALATIAGGLVAGLTFGVGGIIGTVGASTVARHFSTRHIEREIDKARATLEAHVESDVDSIISDATRDCENRISLLYGDISRAIYEAETSWMKAQHALIEQASRPAGEANIEKLEGINTRIETLENLRKDLTGLTAEVG